MDQTKASDIVQSLTVADIRQAYSGRPGCACGCRGKYSCTPDSPEAKDGDKVNVKSVTRILREVQRAACVDTYIENLNRSDGRGWNVADDLQYITAQVSPTRVYTVYLMSAARRSRGVEKGYDL